MSPSKESVLKEAQARFDRAEKDSAFPPDWYPFFAASLGASIVAAWWYLGPDVNLQGDGSAARLELIAKCQIFPAMLFFFFFGSGAAARSTSKGASNDPPAAQALGLQSVKLIEVQRVFQNTLEQYFFFLTATSSLVVRIQGQYLKILPAMYVSWCTMRVFYFFVYTSGYPRYRHLAFTANVMLSAGSLVYAGYLTIIQGF